MIHLFLIFALALTQVTAQRGGEYRGYDDGDWGENEEPPSAQIVTQIQTRTQTQVNVQTQVQTRTMVSTALSMAPTTIVQTQATTIVRVNTILASAVVISTSNPSPAIDPITPSSSPSPTAPVDQSQSPLQQSAPGLTVNDIPSSSSSLSSSSSTQSTTDATTRPIGAASEVSAPVTRLTGTIATLQSGMEVRTTGTPHLGDGAEGLVYGHTTSNGSGRLIGSAFGLIMGVMLVPLFC